MKAGIALPSLAFTRDGKTLMTASPDQTVCFWEPATGKRLRSHRPA